MAGSFLFDFLLLVSFEAFRCRSFLTYPDRLRLPDERLIFAGTENELSIPVRIEYVVRCLLAGPFVLETSLNENRIRNWLIMSHPFFLDSLDSFECCIVSRRADGFD